MKKVLSLGGGLDSFAMLLDAIARGERPDHVVFADVGSGSFTLKRQDGEWPSTYRHIREVVLPLCGREDIPFTWINTVEYPIRGRFSLLEYFESKNIMPTRMSRLCTSAAKVERITSWMEKAYPGEDLEVWIGFEANEIGRAHKDPHAQAARCGSDRRRMNRFPLIERGLCRCRCESLVRVKGYPIPRKSACVYCPFSSRGDFQTLARELPEVFARVERLEANCNKTRSGATIRFSGQGPALREWIEKPYSPRVIPCLICGRKERATKATGCSYLEEKATIESGE